MPAAEAAPLPDPGLFRDRAAPAQTHYPAPVRCAAAEDRRAIPDVPSARTLEGLPAAIAGAESYIVVDRKF